ncbi:MAG: SUMF1/EgtB/PvdO family nonheme iron enzyme [Pseudanabaena sp. CAN_BIN31]|nr:SUMF1/EgtB/PvdO family nonheme iron enzyme [Pseudanabaena sp. CAN_BIN31]
MGRYALLVGISNYTADLKPLPSAVKDVVALRQVLVNPEIGGFLDGDVEVLTDVDETAIRKGLSRLFANRNKDDLLLFYFSGHGVTDSRSDFYLTGISTNKDDLLSTAVSADYVHRAMNQRGSKRQVIILDCCHSGAFPKGMTAKDIGTVNVLPKLGGEGRAILTASDSSQYAFEQEGFELSLYTHFLVEGLRTGAADRDDDGDVSVDELYEYVRDKVKSANNLMSPEFYPVKEGHRIVLAKAAQDDPKLKFRKEVEKVVKRSNGKISAIARNLLTGKSQSFRISTEEANAIISEILRPYQEYAKKLEEYEQALLEAIAEEFPFGEVLQAELKEYENHLGLREEDIIAIVTRIIVPKQAEQEERLKIEQRSFKVQADKPTDYISENLGNGVTLDLLRIPAGKIMMGMPADERQIALDNVVKYGNKREDVEKWLDWSTPQHQATLKEFWLGKFTITNAQWYAVMGTNPSEKYDVKFQGKNQPVVGVSWDDTKEFCKKASEKTGKSIRLPSETEWEYACRAGTNTAFHFGETITSELVNYDGNYPYGDAPKGEYRQKTVNVDSFSPNAWGLYQMHGNVWEWCEDVWHFNYKGIPQDGSPWLKDGQQNRHVVRGGSWLVIANDCRSAFRFRLDTGNSNYMLGFRVVI